MTYEPTDHLRNRYPFSGQGVQMDPHEVLARQVLGPYGRTYEPTGGNWPLKGYNLTFPAHMNIAPDAFPFETKAIYVMCAPHTRVANFRVESGVFSGESRVSLVSCVFCSCADPPEAEASAHT